MSTDNKQKKCFVIMPLITPSNLLELYHNDAEYFIHVFEYLFEEALEKAGYRAISPKSSGSELIHDKIIRNLEKCDMVLCDISMLNANVFFELGIRTALNKPVCLVKNDKTERRPFDTVWIQKDVMSIYTESRSAIPPTAGLVTFSRFENAC